VEDYVKGASGSPEVREVMDIRQAAHYLGISADSLYRYAATGFIPAFRLGNRWRFRKSRLDEWMDRRSGLEEERAPKLVRVQQKKPVRGTRVLGRGSRTGS
jgi:excisionase family DNA binding protein